MIVQHEQELQARLMDAFNRMTSKDRLVLVLFAETSARENPAKRAPKLRLVVNAAAKI